MKNNKEGKKIQDRQFIIPFVGLKIGKHTFDFSVSDSFFETFSYSTIEGGEVNVQLELEKKEIMLIGSFSCQGMINALCDRCNETMSFPISGSFQIIFKFGSETSDDESLVVLPTYAYQLDIEHYVHELIIVSLPSRIVHEDGKCNDEILKFLHQYVDNE